MGPHVCLLALPGHAMAVGTQRWSEAPPPPRSWLLLGTSTQLPRDLPSLSCVPRGDMSSRCLGHWCWLLVASATKQGQPLYGAVTGGWEWRSRADRDTARVGCGTQDQPQQRRHPGPFPTRAVTCRRLGGSVLSGTWTLYILLFKIPSKWAPPPGGNAAASAPAITYAFQAMSRTPISL